jgi:hypothetical protein
MGLLRLILYILSLITTLGAIEGLTGGRIGLHEWLAALPVYPENPVLALMFGICLFAIAEYVSYISGEPPVVLHVAAFLARTLLVISSVLFFVAVAGFILSIIAVFGIITEFKDSFPYVFWGLESAWLSAIIWLIVAVVASMISLALNPRFKKLRRWKGYPDWLHINDLEDVWEAEYAPEEPSLKVGPVMKRLKSRGIRPIIVERNPCEPLGRLAGEVGIMNIFVDCPQATWNEDEILKAMQSVREGLRWIEEEATGRVEIKFKDIGHVRAPTPGWPATDRARLSKKELTEQVTEILGGFGIDDLDELHYYLLRYSDEPGNIAFIHFYLRGGSWCLPMMHPNVGTAYCFHRHDPEVSRAHFLDEDDLDDYPELSCIYAHMILHLFGATDKPVRSVRPNIDIMSAVSLDIDDLFIGFKTGREIGW